MLLKIASVINKQKNLYLDTFIGTNSENLARYREQRESKKIRGKKRKVLAFRLFLIIKNN